jgi:peptide/nickel transport system permease protein
VRGTTILETSPRGRPALIAFIVKRALGAAVTLLLVASVVFVIFFVIPHGGGVRPRGGVSSVALLMGGRQAPLSELRRIDHNLGLDRPVWVQYGMYMDRLAHFDLGHDYYAGAPVWSVLKPAIPPTLSIAVGASLVWVVGGIVFGVFAAKRRGSFADKAAMGAAVAALSIPIFVVALIGIHLVYRWFNVYAGKRYVAITESPLAWLQSMWLPWLALAFPLIAIYARTVRSSLLEVKDQEYMRTAVAKGLKDRRIARHQLRGGLTPIVTMYGLDFGLLLGGSMIIEKIFDIPGLGLLLLNSRSFYDFPVMSGIVIIAALGVIVANLVVDIAYWALDPRVRLAGPTRAFRTT